MPRRNPGSHSLRKTFGRSGRSPSVVSSDDETVVTQPILVISAAKTELTGCFSRRVYRAGRSTFLVLVTSSCLMYASFFSIVNGHTTRS